VPAKKPPDGDKSSQRHKSGVLEGMQKGQRKKRDREKPAWKIERSRGGGYT